MSSKPPNQINSLAHQPSAGLTISRIVALLVALVVTAAILLLSNHIEELQALGYAGAFLIMLIGNATVILMAQKEDATPVYYGDQNLVSALGDIPVDEMPWKTYSI